MSLDGHGGRLRAAKDGCHEDKKGKRGARVKRGSKGSRGLKGIEGEDA